MFCSTQLGPAVGSGACAQPALLAAGAEELAEGECPVAAAIISSFVRAPGERNRCLYRVVCTWGGGFFRAVPGVFDTPAAKRTL